MTRMIKWLCIFLVTGTVYAQMPHQVLLLVNKNSQPSKKVANVFADLRQIPKRNIVYLDIPARVYGGKAVMTPEEFTRLIWEPANAALEERGIKDHILAWVYSVDFPIRVKTDPNDRKQMSICGLTFTRNEIPELSLVEEGKFQSRLFGGPNRWLDVKVVPMSLSVQKKGLADRMPLPGMMLGYIGQNGSTVETVLQCLRNGKVSDHQMLRKGIYFVDSDDVRSKCRSWQFYPAVNELRRQRIDAVVTTNFPAGAENVGGLLMGAEKVDPSAIKSFAPGAMAEHLTSWSAEFQKPQTKATAWIDAGATASAGSVVEPYSIADKFPSARFFFYYGIGCTMLESFYQSIACPLQILLLGDPMAKPNARPLALQVLGTKKVVKDFTFFAKARSANPNAQYLYTFLLDGKVIRELSNDPTVYLRAIKMADGHHELRAVACLEHPALFNTTAVKEFVVDLYGRSVVILPSVQKIDDFRHTIKVEIGGSEMPEKLRLVSGNLVLDEQPYAADAELVLDERVIGEGPNRVRALAVYADAMEVSSPPLDFEIHFSTEP